MGRSPCCSKEGLNRGAWTALEDKILTSYIKTHGEGKWRNLPKRAGLKRCGKSCRLRWLNYLRPDIKRGNISHDEEELIIRLHNLLGNRWSLIAGRLPGRTDNEIKNYWNTTLGKRAKAAQASTNGRQQKPTKAEQPSNSVPEAKVQVIRTKATRCTTKTLAAVPLQPPPAQDDTDMNSLSLSHHPSSQLQGHEGGREAVLDELHGHDDGEFLLNFGINDQMRASSVESDQMQPLPFDEAMFEDNWTTNPCLDDDDNAAMDLDSLAFLLDPDEWP